LASDPEPHAAEPRLFPPLDARSLASLSVASFVDLVADPRPLPAAVAAASVAAALAAALGEMALARAQMSQQRRQEDVDDWLAKLRALRQEFLRTADSDASAYAAYLSARREGGDAARLALHEATRIPLEALEASRTLGALLAAARETCPPALAVDYDAAFPLLDAAAAIFAACCRANLARGELPELAARLRRAEAALREEVDRGSLHRT